MKNYYGIIYCATNKINNKKYIGQTTKGLNQRKRNHISHAKRENKYSFQQAINKYGEDNFTWKVIDYANNQEELDKKEIYWIKYWNTFCGNGYNMTHGGQINSNEDPDERSLTVGGRKFLVFDLNGTYIKSTISQDNFANEIGVCNKVVNNVLLGVKHSTKGYILIFEDEYNEEMLNEKIKLTNQNYEPFIVLNKLNEPIGIWYDKKACSEVIGLNIRSIQRQLKKSQYTKYARTYQLFYLTSLPEDIKDDIEFKINNNQITIHENKRMERYYA